MIFSVLDTVINLPLWQLLTLFIVIMSVIHHYTTYSVFRRIGVYCPTPWPFVGNALFYLRYGLFDGTQILHLAHKDKRVYGMYEGRAPIMSISDLDMIQEITVKQFNNFTNRKAYAVLNQNIISGVMNNLKGAIWKEQRSLLKPSISPARLKAVSGRMETVCKRLLDNLNEKAEKDGEVEVFKIIGCFCMDIMADFTYDIKVDSMENPDHEFVSAGYAVLNSFGESMFLFEYFAPKFIKGIMDYFGLMILPKHAVEYFRKFSEKAIKERRAAPKENQTKQFDLLQYLLERSESDNSLGVKRPFTDEEMHSALLSYILAGFDTISKSLAYILYQLVMNPICYKKLQQELDEELQGEFPNKTNTERLSYLTKVIDEGNRLYPLGFFTERTCNKDSTVKGQFIPKGMVIRVPICGIQRDPEYFPNPNYFDPERWSPEEIKKRPHLSYLVWGNGPRACFGQQLAMMILRLGLASIVQAFDMEANSKSESPIRLTFLGDLMPAHPLMVSLSPRKKKV